MRYCFRIVVVSLALICGACAHSITIVPDAATLGDQLPMKIDKLVGYYISPENHAKKVETAAGGGDKVAYSPYADLEPGLNKVLSNVFTQVVAIKDLND